MTQSVNLWNPLNQLRRLYDWTMKWADHPKNVYALGGLATIESIFFPIPVDPLMMAMGIANPKRCLLYSTIMTVFSVLGAFLGYWIGAAFWHLTSDFFFTYVFSPEIFQKVAAKYEENAALSILVASFTPLPFKVFTISAGVAKLPLLTVILASIAGRGARFFLVGTLIYFFGGPIRVLIEKYFNWLAAIFGILLVGSYYLLPMLLN